MQSQLKVILNTKLLEFSLLVPRQSSSNKLMFSEFSLSMNISTGSRKKGHEWIFKIFYEKLIQKCSFNGCDSKYQ